MPYQGRTGAVGLGEEVTWGTAVARTTWRPAIRADLLRKVTRPPVPDLFATGGSAMRRRHFDQAEEAGGTVELFATYDNVGMWLKHALGSLATVGAGPFTHTYTLASDVPEGLTMELIRGLATNSEVFEGCRINRFTLRCAAGEVMRIIAEIIAQTAAVRAAAGAPAFASTETPVLHHQAGSLTFNAVSYTLISMELVLENALARRQELGSKLTKQPLRNDFSNAMLSATLQSEDTMYTALHADTRGDVVFAFTSGTKSVTITLHNGVVLEAADPIEGAGLVTQSVKWECENDGTDLGLSIVVVNDNASGIAN